MSRRLNREWPCEAKGNDASSLLNGSTTQVRLFGLEMILAIAGPCNIVQALRSIHSETTGDVLTF